MGDTVQEIESVVQQLEGILPIFGTVIGAIVPAAAPVATLAGPFLSILDEVLQSIETLKTGGMSHTAAVATVGSALTSIGQTLTAAVPQPAAQAAAPVVIPHETH